MTFHLSHLPADYDLVVYGPPETQLRPSIASAVPLDEPPVTDDGVDPTHATDALPSQTLDDLRLQPSLPMVGVSAMRGTDPEDIVVVSQGGGGFYTVQITGYNAATSPKPYMLRVVDDAAARDVDVDVEDDHRNRRPGAAGNLPAGLNTVFLVNRHAAARALRRDRGVERDQRALEQLVGVRESRLPERRPLRRPLRDRADRVRELERAPRRSRRPRTASSRRSTRVLDSADPREAERRRTQVPRDRRRRPGDPVRAARRLHGHGQQRGRATRTRSARTRELFATLNAGQMLSDDPYGDVNPVPYLNRQLYIPELAVGRLVETPGGDRRRAEPLRQPGRAGPPRPDDRAHDRLRLPARRRAAPWTRRCGDASAATNPTGLLGNSWTLQNLTDSFLPAARSAVDHLAQRARLALPVPASGERDRDDEIAALRDDAASPAPARRSRTGSSSAWAVMPGSRSPTRSSPPVRRRSTGRRHTRRRAPAPTSAIPATATATASSSRTPRS